MMSGEVDEKKMWQKVKGLPCDVKDKMLETVFTLWVLLKSPCVPLWVKATIATGLMYFISPIDAVPDFLPGGFIDDLAVMGVILAQVKAFRTVRVKREVKQMLDELEDGKLETA